jgi:hypothetical protein
MAKTQFPTFFARVLKKKRVWIVLPFVVIAYGTYVLFTGVLVPTLETKVHNQVRSDINNGMVRVHTAKITPPLSHRAALILDLDGAGVETTGVKDGAYFDHNADGFAEQTGWVGADDGLLVRDLNGNGTIDSGRELFGNQTLLNNGTLAANGFQALAELDTNHDGKVGSADAAFSSLRVWKDLDGDGYTSAGELFTLADAGVQSLNVGYTTSAAVDANGNAHKQIGSYTKADGTTAAAEDVWFKTDPAYTIATDWLDVPADIAALPDLQGYGTVYDLHQAMARDTSGALEGLVQSFIGETNVAARNALFDQILFKWAGSDGIAAGSRGSAFDAVNDEMWREVA